MRLPKVLGLVLCWAFEVDRAAGEVLLRGIFNALHFRDWPSPPQRFAVYSVLQDGVGEGTIKLEVVRLETEQVVHRYQKWVALPGRGSYFNLVIPITNGIFPSPGRYKVALYFDNQELSGRLLDIYPE